MHETWIPIALFGMILGIVCGAFYFAYSVRRLQNREKMLALEKGLPIPLDRTADPARLIARARRTAIILISTGIGIALSFGVIAWVEKEMDALNGSALGIIPLLIGIGLLIDYRLQVKEFTQLNQG
jgi:Domain of unknown function (DUF6249)